MKIHEAPNFLPKYPDYVDTSASNFYVELEKILNLNPGTPNTLLKEACLELAQKIYIAAGHNIIRSDSGAVKVVGPRQQLHSVFKRNESGEITDELEKISVGKVPRSKVKNRFDHLFELFKKGVGMGYAFSLTSFRDAYFQDLALEPNDSIIARMEENRKRYGAGKYTNPSSIFSRLMEQHRNLIRIESVMTESQALMLPPVFVKNVDGADKEYVLETSKKRRSKQVYKMRRLTEPYDLELSTYLQDFCIGASDQDYKKSLVDGTMLFFSFEMELAKPRTLQSVAKSNLAIAKKYDNEFELDYLTEAIGGRPELGDFKVRRNPLNAVTISAKVTKDKRLTFDQFKIVKDFLVDSVKQQGFSELFIEHALPDLCAALQRDGYKIDGFGDDLSTCFPNGKVYVIGKGYKDIWDIVDADLVVGDLNQEYEVPETISKELLLTLCQKKININITNINHRIDLLESLVHVNGNLRSDAEIVKLPNLESVQKLSFSRCKRVFLPKLKKIGSKIESDTFFSVEELDIRSLPHIDGSLYSVNLKVGRFDELIEITQQLDLPHVDPSHVWYFPKLEKVSEVLVTKAAYECPVLEEVGEIRITNSLCKFPTLRKVVSLLVENCSVDLPGLTVASKSVTVIYWTLVPLGSAFINLPNLQTTMSIRIITEPDQELRIDISSLDLGKIRPENFTSNTFFNNHSIIYKDPESFNSYEIWGSKSLKEVIPKYKIFRSRGEYAIKTQKIWTDVVL